MQKQIAVMIVDSSETTRTLLTRIIGCNPRLRLAAAVASGEDALRQLERVAPDVISMDIDLPGMDGIETTRLIMAVRPTPVVIVSSPVGKADATRAIRALEAGAVAVVEKPQTEKSNAYVRLASRLAGQLVAMSSVRLVQQRFNNLPVPCLDAPPSLAFEIAPAAPLIGTLGIVASTGGPGAILSVLSGLPLDFPMPILIVQHIGGDFTDGFVEWLSHSSPFPARIAPDGAVPAPGQIYVAPGDAHMTMDAGRIRLDRGAAVDGHRPSGTVMLMSLAQHCGPSAIGVLLTGMGEDGARGLAAMHEAGSWTIAQDESTSVVYGMPAVAAKLGAASEILPLSAIPTALRIITDRRRRVTGGSRVDVLLSAKPML